MKDQTVGADDGVGDDNGVNTEVEDKVDAGADGGVDRKFNFPNVVPSLETLMVLPLSS